MNKTRKELGLGAILFVLWLLMKIFPRSGFMMTLLLIVAVALVVIGLLPDNLYQEIHKFKQKLLPKK